MEHKYCHEEIPTAVVDELHKSIEELSDTEVRFLVKTQYIDIGKSRGCWEWNARIRDDGYGSFWYQGNMELAHRVSYELFIGSIPEDLIVRHVACRRKECVNPYHLSVGTRAHNMQDAIRDGTHICLHLRGEMLCNALNPDEVRAIRRRYEEENVTYADLAEDYDTSESTVGRVVRRVTYDHIE